MKKRQAAGARDLGAVIQERQGREGVSLLAVDAGSELAWEGGTPAWQHWRFGSACLTGCIRSEWQHLNRLGPAPRIAPHLPWHGFWAPFLVQGCVCGAHPSLLPLGDTAERACCQLPPLWPQGSPSGSNEGWLASVLLCAHSLSPPP